jgi:hypothetical protein
MSGMGMDMGSLGGLFGGGGIGGVMNPMMVGGTGMINPMISGMGMTNPMMMDPNFNAALNPMMMGGMGMMNPMMGGMGMMNPMMGGMGMMNPMMGGMGMGGMMPPFIDAGPMPGIGYNPMMMPSMYPGMGGCIDTSPSCSIMQISATGCNTAVIKTVCLNFPLLGLILPCGEPSYALGETSSDLGEASYALSEASYALGEASYAGYSLG